MKIFTGSKFLLIYSGLLTLVFVLTVVFGIFTKNSSDKFDQITVHRINVVEPNGTLRLVISNHDELPGIIVRGEEKPFERPQAGMLFYNDEGSENGGLIFGGHKNKKGDIVNSGGSLSFDKYGANQIVQLAGVDDSEDRFAGLLIMDSPTGNDNRRRVWVGREDDGTATVALMDGKGRKRILMQVKKDGSSSLLFLNEKGEVVNMFPTKNSK
jgi:hypothetical protein